MKRVLFLLMLGGFGFFISCEKEPEAVVVEKGQFEDGLFICNEGPFMSGTGTVTFTNVSGSTYYKDIYESVNLTPLGNIVQSMTIINDKAYIVVNNANKIEVVNMADFKRITTIEGLTLPRYVVQAGPSVAYISCWDNTVAVLDLTTNAIIKSIPCQTGPEQMLKAGNYVFVLNQGGFATDSLITVINTQNNTVVNTLHVGNRPSGIVLDKNGQVWVLCAGKGYNGWPQADDTPGALYVINPVNFTIIKDEAVFEQSNHPDKLAVNSAGDVLYFLYDGGICQRSILSASTEVIPFIHHSGSMYTMGFDKKHNRLLFSDPVDYVQDGWVYSADPVTGIKTDSIKAGIIPGYFCFN